MKTVDDISRRYHESRRAAAAQESLRRRYRRIDLAFAAIGALAATDGSLTRDKADWLLTGLDKGYWGGAALGSASGLALSRMVSMASTASAGSHPITERPRPAAIPNAAGSPAETIKSKSAAEAALFDFHDRAQITQPEPLRDFRSLQDFGSLNSRERRSGWSYVRMPRLTLHLTRRTWHVSRPRQVLIRPDVALGNAVAVAVHRAGVATLVGRGTVGRGSGINSRAAGQQGLGEGRAAVVLQRAE